MDRLLIAGVDSVVGANLAAWWGGRRPVTGLGWQHALAIEGCEIEGPVSPLEPPTPKMLASQPDWVVFCGPGAVSSWNEQRPDWNSCDWSRAAAQWAEAARDWGAEFTLLSSDAVFTGPWMFHRETGTCFCDSPEARLLRQTEQAVLTANPHSLIVRTNAFGWAPLPELAGLPEQVLETLTNDGELANRLTHPRFEMAKGYEVMVAGRVDEAGLAALERALFPRGSAAEPDTRPRLVILKRDAGRTLLYMDIREGANREIRPLLGKLGHPVKKLRRVSMGPLQLKGLQAEIGRAHV